MAKAAGLDAAAQDRRTLSALLVAPATSRASEGFYKPYKSALAALFAADPALAAVGRELFPQAGGNAFFGWWLDVLDAGGALGPLLDGSAAPGSAASWLSRAMAHCRRGWQAEPPPAQMFGIIDQLAATIRADGVPVSPQTGNRQVDANLVDALLEHGLPVNPGGHVDLAGWLASAADGTQRPLTHLTQDPAFAERVQAAVADYPHNYQSDRKVDDLLVAPALAPFVSAWLQERAESFGAHGLARAGAEVVVTLMAATGPSTFRANPGAYEIFARASMHHALARTLAGGLIDELGWPALEEAAAQLVPGEARWTSAWPSIVVLDNARAVVAGPEAVGAAHDLRIPGNARWANPRVRFVDGQFLVIYHDSGDRGYWSGQPGEVFPISVNSYGSIEVCTTTADGGRVGGGRPLHVGDRSLDEEHEVFSDGATVWRLERETGVDATGRWRSTTRLRELEPTTGATGRVSLPAWLEEFAPTAGELDLAASSLMPATGLTESPLGLRDGMVGTRVRRRVLDDGSSVVEVESIDGRRATLSADAAQGASTVFGLVGLPGLAEPALLTQAGLWDSTGTFQLSPSFVGDQRPATSKMPAYHYRPYDDRWRVWGTPFVPPARLWHALRPRDVPGSLALRRVDDALALRLLDAAVADLAADADDVAMPLTRQAIAAALPEITHPRLVDGVVGLVRGAAGVQQELRSFVATRSPSDDATSDGPDPAGIVGADLVALGNVGLGGGRHGRGAGRPGVQISSVGRYLTGELSAELLVSDFPTTTVQWPALVGHAGAVAYLATSPATDEAGRTGLLRFLEVWATTPFVGDLDGIRVGKVIRVEPRAGEDEGDGGDPPRRYVVLPGARHGHQGRTEYWYVSATGAAPPDATEVEVLELRPDWTAEQTLAFVASARERGPVPVTEEAIARLRQRTGMNRAEAALLLGGLPNIDQWEANFIDAPTRSALGLKLAEAKAGREGLRSLSTPVRLALLDAGAGREPGERWDPTAEGGPIDAMADVWNALVGRRATIPDDALVDARAVPSDLPPATWLPMLADPAAAGPLHTDGRWEVKAGRWQEELRCSSDDAFAWVHAATFAHAFSWAFARPVGDPLRTHLGLALDLVRQRLANPDLLVPFRSCWCGSDDTEAIASDLGPAEPNKAGVRVHDTGQLVVVTVSESRRIGAFLRPAHLDDGPIHPAVLAVHWPRGSSGDPLHVIRRLLDTTFDAFAARVAATPVPAGGYEANPADSAPDLVATVADALGVGPDAAALHLQLLTLLDPTDRNVRTWNGWTPARHKKAQAELVAVGAVVEAKRERAGRSAFVAGGWLKVAAPDLPVELWKLPLYDSGVGDDGKVRPHLGRLLPLRPHHELFEAAWTRVVGGDGPGATP